MATEHKLKPAIKNLEFIPDSTTLKLCNLGQVVKPLSVSVSSTVQMGALIETILQGFSKDQQGLGHGKHSINISILNICLMFTCSPFGITAAYCHSLLASIVAENCHCFLHPFRQMLPCGLQGMLLGPECLSLIAHLTQRATPHTPQGLCFYFLIMALSTGCSL